RALSRSDDERAAAEPRHARLEGGERAQRRIEEEESQDLARERVRLRMRLEAARQLEERQHLLALEVRQVEETLHAGSSRHRMCFMRGLRAHRAADRRAP